MKNFLKQLLSLILPITVLVIVPLSVESRLSLAVDILSVIGALFIAVGVFILALTISMFIRLGRGTLAPWSPTKKLVVSGIYSHTRNPMITGVLLCLLGESMMFHSVNIFTWFILFFLINNIYFTLFEEPSLTKRFGKEYLEYKRNVPRWIPRSKG